MKKTTQKNRIKNIEYGILNIEKNKEDNSKFKIRNSRFCASGAGFTLIELLVVFSLTAILSGIGIVSFSNYNKLQQLSQSANNAQLLINQARFNSLSVVKKSSDSKGVSQNCGSQTLTGYYVEIFNATSELRLYLDCKTLSPALIKTVALPKNLTLDSKTTCTKIRFNSLTAMPSGVPCNIVLSGYGQQKTITVDTGGNTSIQ